MSKNLLCLLLLAHCIANKIDSDRKQFMSICLGADSKFNTINLKELCEVYDALVEYNSGACK